MMLEDYYDLTDEINPNPGRYVPDYWEMPTDDDGTEMTEEELDWLDSWLENCPPEPDRDGRREAYYQNGMIPPFPLY